MESKIRVYGKAQNRTALGIMHAYMTIHPEATLDDLREAFPDSLNPDSGVKKNFIPLEEKDAYDDWDGFFRADDEVLTMGDGSKVAVVKMWTKPSFTRLVEHAKLFGIEVAQFEAAEKGFGKKGSFQLEYLNGWQPTEKKEEEPKRKGSKWWLWVILILVVLGILAALFWPKEEPQPQVKVVEKVVEKKVVVRDTVYVQQVAEIQDKFNAAQFEKGKSDLNVDAQIALHDLASVMKQNPNLRISIEGHTSSEGDAKMNQKLSEDRAKAAVDYLVNKEGIDASRLTAVGKGSSEPIDPNNLEKNRRTEFKILK